MISNVTPKRWHADRIGGMFTANAEAIADLALARPRIGMAEIGFGCEGNVPGSPSKVEGDRLPGGCGTIHGWSKSERPELLGKQVFLGMVATLIGAPSAPYLLVRGVDRLFSPLCVETPRRIKGIYGNENPVALGAAGQWRAWINDADWFSQNSMACDRTGAFYLFDHELADPCNPELHLKTGLFLQEGKDMQRNAARLRAYHGGESAMAARITAVEPKAVLQLAVQVRDAGMIITDRFVDGLVARAGLFRQPLRPRTFLEPPPARPFLKYA